MSSPGLPRLSFVLAIHREQAYVEQCVSSVLGQGVADVEIVAIDDASDDHAPAILDALAERDPRVVVRHLEARVGPGEARNLGLELATGDHVWFIDPTDRLVPGALSGVLERLAADAPDVLLVHHSGADGLGRVRTQPPAAALMRLVKQGPGKLESAPGVADTAHRVWDKVFRRALLDAAGARFGRGRQEAMTVAWPALLAAQRIAAFPQPAYVRSRPRNADRDLPGSPHDVFPQAEAVLAGVPDARRKLVVEALLRHQLRLLRALPRDEQRAFFAEISRAYRRQGGGARGRAAQLVERGSYAGFSALETARNRRRALGRRRRQVRRLARRVVRRAGNWRMERYYAARRRRPIDPDLAVFAAYWYRSYACNPRAIYEKARELVPGMRGVWVVRPEAVGVLPPGVEYVIAGTREYYDVMARAGVFVNNVNFPNNVVKREGTKHVMTHHGTPLKKMGLDEQDSPVLNARKDFPALMRRCARWDYSVSSNTFSTLIWERVYPTRYESLEVGYPRNDVLATAGEEDVRAAREALGIEPGTTAVLYAPTHREQQRDGYVHALDVARFADGLGPEHVLLVRTHYFYGADPVLRDLHRQGRVVDVATHPSIEQLCLATDVLVTDYSSLMFDYAVLDRPIVVYAPDWETYRIVRGTYFDLMEEPPGAVARTEEELLDAFRTGAIRSEQADAARAAFRARFCTLDDGHAAERVVRRVWLGERGEVAAPTMAATSR